jgi:parallel beta-helix repeat protein
MKTRLKMAGLLTFCITLQSQAQIINMNPDPLGEPWWSGGAVAPPPGTVSDAYEFIPSAASLATPLPSSAYNHNHVWFPYIYYQDGNSCVQVAEIFYTFAYEINRKRNVVASNPPNKTNLYHSLYTYNFLNQGSGISYTLFTSGFNIIKQNGCPSWDVFDDPALYNYLTKYKYWMTGYNNYYAGMLNTISKVNLFNYATSSTSLNNLKHWIADHGNGEATGGLAVIGVNTSGWDANGIVPGGSPYHAGEKFIASLGTPGSGHALTIVGYNDDIWIQDINEDGLYTNDIDVNGDGVVNIHDFEKGAFLVANSWGQAWNDPYGGYILIPYKHFYPGNPGLVISYAYSCSIFDNSNEIPEPSLSYKASIEHPARNKISMRVGYAPLASNSEPTFIANYNSFNFQGGANPMRGAYAGPIENGLNFGYHYGGNDFGKVFLKVVESDPDNTSNGTINYFSLIDHRWGEDFELSCDQTNIPIVNNGHTILAIEYHLLPHDEYITENMTLLSNSISRFITTVANNAVLSIDDGVRIDMYNSEININAGSTLFLGNDVTFLAKKGHCRIVIDGNISIGTNLNLHAEEDAILELILLNPDIVANFYDASFNNTSLSQYGAGLTLNNCTFNNCDIIYSTGNSTINDCTFAGTSLFLDNLSRDPDKEVEVLGNTFANSSMNPAIWIWSYDNFKIENNVIQDSEVGIKLSYSGNGAINNTIKDNHIYNCASSGLEAYASYAVLENNNIHENFVGIKLMNSSNTAIIGDQKAQYYSETQLIRFNTSYELYASLGSFPWQLRHNVIWDEFPPNAPLNYLIYYDIPHGYKHSMLDIRDNCLGENFNPLSNLYPHTYYNYQPPWCPPGGELKSGDPIEDLYMGALDQMENGNYVEARNQFQQLIELYPTSPFAISAMKELFRNEKFALNDFAGLKQYFRTNDSIVADTTLMHIGDKLANKCDVELENWIDAINWYEDMIINPLSFQDSIFAIIDLGYVYMLMENQVKSSYVGRLKEFKPETKEIYFAHKNYLLSLLPGERYEDKPTVAVDKSSQGRLLQNVPNPFSETTQIEYILENEALVTITINDLTGKVLKQFNEGHKSKGAHKIDVIKKDLAPGTYFYILHLNGTLSDNKRMILINQ